MKGGFRLTGPADTRKNDAPDACRRCGAPLHGPNVIPMKALPAYAVLAALLACGQADASSSDWVEMEGARTAAAFGAAQYGPILKVSEDGQITCFDQGRRWEI